ncbi:glutamyl-tRNA reductase [Nocardioides alcanivorans]|uniref:glutamyl-tRNA reductase n=1 Tax=Nocardioides alcanivorans TaxID=2897352 RepID=UPI001F25D37B|nr:glutamyl-tRNA reductase [Nocardioides alcanivorans]
MSVLVVGVSHRTASVDVLEQLTLDTDGVGKLMTAVADTEHVTEATVLSTCNRLEIYAEVERFHGTVETLSRLVCAVGPDDPVDPALLGSLYVHYGDAAVAHLFNVSAGLDSMVIGEGQILGQAREALRMGQENGSVGAALNLLFQQALRVGKRSHAETDIDRAAPSLIGAALDLTGEVAGRRALVIGAGAMASVAVATLARRGVASLTVVNRSSESAVRLADEYAATVRPLVELDQALRESDVIVSCTGANGIVLTADQVEAARAGITDPLTVIDLALPRDVEDAVGVLPGVRLENLRKLSEELADSTAAKDVAGAREIVTEEIEAFLSARRQASVTPTVVALRSMATSVVDAEIERVFTRLDGLNDLQRGEVEQAIRRVADKLLHQPTTRVKELANETGAVSYAAALAELFSLDPDAVDAVTRPGGRS